jgi:NAD(P)-dependent dehydrogenase (short-subunit alcohol dehydrogenase family)
MDLKLKGKIAIVTRGTPDTRAFAIVKALTAEGVTVTVPGRRPEKLDKAVNGIGRVQPSSQMRPQPKEPMPSSSKFPISTSLSGRTKPGKRVAVIPSPKIKRLKAKRAPPKGLNESCWCKAKASSFLQS